MTEKKWRQILGASVLVCGPITDGKPTAQLGEEETEKRKATGGPHLHNVPSAQSVRADIVVRGYLCKLGMCTSFV